MSIICSKLIGFVMVSLSLTLNAYSIHLVYLLSFLEVDSELGQTYMMELFAKIVNG